MVNEKKCQSIPENNSINPMEWLWYALKMKGNLKNISFDFLLFSYGSFRKCLAVIFHIKSVVDTLVSFMSYTEACVRTKGLVKIERAFSIFAVESVIPPRYWHWHRQ